MTFENSLDQNQAQQDARFGLTLRIKTFFELNSTAHENYHANTFQNANNCWHINNYEHYKYNTEFVSKKSLQKVFILQQFSLYERLKFPDELSM